MSEAVERLARKDRAIQRARRRIHSIGWMAFLTLTILLMVALITR